MSALVATPSDLQVVFRNNEPADEAFIMKTWKMRLANTPEYNWAGWDRALHTLDRVCAKLYKRCGATVVCNPNRPSHILGFAVKEPSRNTAHFVYVHEAYRRQGLARTLLAGLNLPVRVSFWTPECQALAERYHLIYVPVMRRRER